MMPQDTLPQKALLVDHVCHSKTNSVRFLHTILQEHFDLTVHYYDHAYQTKLRHEFVSDYDFLIFFEFLPGRFRQFFSGQRNIFFPMYDNEWESKWCWKRIALTNMPVVSFCTHVTRFARQHGVQNILDVKFFPNPSDYRDMRGDPRVLLLWERGQINFSLVKTLFAPGDMKEIILFRHPEESVQHAPLSEVDLQTYNVRVFETGYLPREQYLETLRSAGTVIGPRKKEGIGMVFLEAMAMRKCVLAHNDATMNEYIIQGKNGILFDADNPHRLDPQEISRIHANIPSPAPYYDTWLRDRESISAFIKQAHPLKLTGSAILFFSIYYLFFLLEAVRTHVTVLFRNHCTS